MITDESLGGVIIGAWLTIFALFWIRRLGRWVRAIRTALRPPQP